VERDLRRRHGRLDGIVRFSGTVRPRQSACSRRAFPRGEPGANTVLVLRTAGFENDNNPDDPLPQGEVSIRPSTNSYGLTTAVDGGEFAYEVNWTISLLSTGVVII
jgi:hypothetical protein